MAQPLNEIAPSFCLSMYGKDSKFTYNDIIIQWAVVKSLGIKEDIKIIGFTSDEDTRLLKAMQINSFKSEDKSNDYDTNSTNNRQWPLIENVLSKTTGDKIHETVYVQDTVHIGTKFRTQFLKPSIVLPMRSYFDTADHIQTLTKQFSKDKYFLTITDLKLEDKTSNQLKKYVRPKCKSYYLKYLIQKLQLSF